MKISKYHVIVIIISSSYIYSQISTEEKPISFSIYEDIFQRDIT